MKLLDDLYNHLYDMKVDWHLCGGFAIDVFLGEITRKHKDKDITVSFDVVINKLEKERYDWFINAMNIEYPQGHPWIKK